MLIFSRASPIALLRMDAMWFSCHNCSFHPLPMCTFVCRHFVMSTLCSLLCLLIFRPHDRQLHRWVWIKGEFRVIIVIFAPCPICTCLDAHFKCPVRWALFETLVFSQTTSVPSPRLVIWSFSCFNCYSCSPPKCVLLTLDIFCLFSRGTCPGVLKLHIDLCFSLPRRSKSILGWLIKKWQICFHITLYSRKVSTELHA